MRLWSINFKYLDAKGLVALWRESLLAKHVLEGKTKGYTNHPQLQRFKESKSPLTSINTYLYYVYEESKSRGYHFSKEKIDQKKIDLKLKLSVTSQQISYEFDHLLSKLQQRDIERYRQIKDIKRKQCCPMFNKISGKIESWEVIPNHDNT